MPAPPPQVREPPPQPKPAAAPAPAVSASEPEHGYMLVFLGFVTVLFAIIALIAGTTAYAIFCWLAAAIALVMLIVRLARRGAAPPGSDG
jgi:hypothetical protein